MGAERLIDVGKVDAGDVAGASDAAQFDPTVAAVKGGVARGKIPAPGGVSGEQGGQVAPEMRLVVLGGDQVVAAALHDLDQVVAVDV